MGGGSVEVLKHHVFLKGLSIRILQRNECLQVEDGGTKRNFFSESINSNLKVDHGLSLESGRVFFYFFSTSFLVCSYDLPGMDDEKGTNLSTDSFLLLIKIQF